MRIPLASAGLRDVDIAAALEVLNSGNLTMGAKVKAFEQAMARFTDFKHFVMVNSGSSANLAIFEALLRPSFGKPKLSPGDGVLVPSIAWPTTIWPVIQLGLDPIFVDVDPQTLALDLNQASELLDSRKITNAKAIFPIHPLGFGLGPEYAIFANKYNLTYISDVCESLGSFPSDRHAGSDSLAASYSFYFSHHITTMEGGGIGTNDDAMADDLRSIRSHGWSRDRSDVASWTADVSDTDSKFLFVTTGYNIRPMEVQAAIGLEQIKGLTGFVESRRRIAKAVASALEETNLRVLDASLSTDAGDQSHSWMLIPIQVTGEDAVAKKLKITNGLNAAGIETRPVLTGNFLAQPSIRRLYDHLPPPSAFPAASRITETAFLVGSHHDLTQEQIDYLVATLSTLAQDA